MNTKEQMDKWEREFVNQWQEKGTDTLQPGFQQLLLSQKLNKLIEVLSTPIKTDKQ